MTKSIFKRRKIHSCFVKLFIYKFLRLENSTKNSFNVNDNIVTIETKHVNAKILYMSVIITAPAYIHIYLKKKQTYLMIHIIKIASIIFLCYF